MAQALDTSVHERRRAERARDPEFRAAYERAAGAIAQTDDIIRTLDELRVEMGVSKAELARRIDRNASSIRRLFTAQQARPELPLIAEIAEALGLRIAVVPESAEAKKAMRKHHAARKDAVAGARELCAHGRNAGAVG
jgi:ribosome-binding protein aMBF1 (putative translation factor)